MRSNIIVKTFVKKKRSIRRKGSCLRFDISSYFPCLFPFSRRRNFLFSFNGELLWDSWHDDVFPKRVMCSQNGLVAWFTSGTPIWQQQKIWDFPFLMCNQNKSHDIVIEVFPFLTQSKCWIKKSKLLLYYNKKLLVTILNEIQRRLSSASFMRTLKKL